MDIDAFMKLPPEEQIKQVLLASGAMIVIDLVMLTIYLSGLIYYLMTMSRALASVAPHNRSMEPGMAYLGLIPVFQLIWFFYIAQRVTGSLQKEFEERGVTPEGGFGKGAGLTGAVVMVVTCGALSPVWVVCALLHARRVRACLRQLEAVPPSKPAAASPSVETGYEEGY